MGYGTYLTTDLYYNRKSYTSRYEVENDLDDVRQIISNLKTRLRTFAFMTEPQKFMDKEEYSDPMWFIEHEINEILEELDEYIVEEYKLSILLEHWEHCHTKDGKPILPPEGFGHWNTAYIDGDFIAPESDIKDAE